LRLRPMVHALVRARQAAQANEARFVAAMESSLDSFYILKAERDAAGVVIDFRFTYVTARGAALISRTPADVEGQLLCELLPVNRTGGFFDKYKAVLDSGFSLAEEFPIHEDGVVASWLSHQVVKLGDDSIAITTRDISARKHDEQALQQSEERLRMVTDSVPALIAYLDMDERYLFINRGGAELYGLAVHDIVGKTVFEVVGSENYALMKPHIEVVRAGYPVTYEREVLRPNGVRHVLTSYLPRYDDQGVVTNVCALGHDITERKQMEAALAVSQESLKAVTDNVPALISYIDREHRFRFANLAYQAWLGVDPASLIGRSLGELYGEAAFAKIRPYLDRALAGETLSYERELEARDGVRHVHATMTPHRNSGGDVVGLYVLMNDITPLKRAEQKSALSEERLTMALDGSHLALFDWSVTTNQVYHSAHWSSMLGGPAQETTTSLQSLSQLVHPDDLPVVLAKLSGALKGSIPFYSAEHRVRTSAGEWLWILSRGRVVERDADGRALRLSGTNADISEQKRIEAQLQRMVEIDALTGLPNRVLFNDRLHRALDRVHLKGKPMALMLLDIDFFKQINDGMGHDAGDAVLQEFAHRLASTVRQTDTVARLGGDEFTIILEELHTPLEAELVAAKILAAMKDDFIYAGQFMRVTTSIGVAYQDQPLDDPAKLIKRADQALYSAKAAGRNGYRCAEPPAVA
jgi:diguanylate cyclase (GGDEF)-like protein/PAS domain S-box-containing protein